MTEEDVGPLRRHLSFMTADLDDPEVFERSGPEAGGAGQGMGRPGQPHLLPGLAPRHDRAGGPGAGQGQAEPGPPARARIVVEKPFGHDLDSARKLNRSLTGLFHESQIYRIDHYLGKETVQNILAFRFANTLFEPIWNRRYIDHVQITVAEAGGRGAPGRTITTRPGALRDMIQNHLLQILCLIAMEPPVSFDADEIRNKKVDVLHAIRPIPPEQVHQYAVRGQYGAGWIEGQHVAGYRREPGVAPDSTTETFAAVKLFVDNWRWQGVPFYLRTGKRLPARISEVSIQFRPVPHQTFPAAAILDCRAQPPAHRHPARRGHSAALRGQAAGADHAPVSGDHAVLLPGGLQGDPARGL